MCRHRVRERLCEDGQGSGTGREATLGRWTGQGQDWSEAFTLGTKLKGAPKTSVMKVNDNLMQYCLEKSKCKKKKNP